MKKKLMPQIAVVVLSLLMIGAGIFVAPLLHRLLFSPEDVVAAQASLEDQLKAGQAVFKQRLLYPLTNETDGLNTSADRLTGEALDVFSADSAMYADGYKALPELMGVNFQSNKRQAPSDSLWAEVYRQNRFLTASLQVWQGEQQMWLQVAMSDYVPVTCFLAPVKKAGSETGGSLDFLQAAIRPGTNENRKLQGDVEQLHRLYDHFPEFQRKMTGVYKNRIAENMDGELLDEMSVSLWECCQYGQWQIFSLDDFDCVASIMEDFTLLLFYDPVSQQLCGFNLAPNE